MKSTPVNSAFSKFKIAFILIISGISGSQNLYAQAGSLDPSFGNYGVVNAKINNGSAKAEGIALQSDGKIVVLASIGGLGKGDIALLRFNANGTSDKSFNGSGQVITDIGHDSPTDLEIQADGKIVVCGYTRQGDSSLGLILRFGTDGKPDP